VDFKIEYRREDDPNWRSAMQAIELAEFAPVGTSGPGFGGSIIEALKTSLGKNLPKHSPPNTTQLTVTAGFRFDRKQIKEQSLSAGTVIFGRSILTPNRWAWSIRVEYRLKGTSEW